MVTPDNITKLKSNELIVVGTNMCGNHGGGLAKYAKDNFGLEEGFFNGYDKKHCYCIATLDSNYRQVPLSYIKYKLLELKRFANEHRDKTIYLTKIGCGIAGFKISDIKKLLPVFPNNVILPVEFKN